MKIIMSLAVFLALASMAFGQEPKTDPVNPPAIPKEYFKTGEDKKVGENKTNGYPISKIALSVNPLGFAQFGPMVNIEAGVTKSLLANAHVRFPTLGVLTYIVNYDDDGLDELSGISFGAGSLYFFGERRSKPYVGILLEYEKLEKLYAKNESWEWKDDDNNGIFILNGGYRYRFKSGLFLNTGAYLGAALSLYKWDYTDPDYGQDDPEAREGTDIAPFGMVEVTVGVEF